MQVERRGASAVALAAVGIGAAFLFRDLLFSGRVPSAGDLSAYYWPAKSLVAPLTRASAWPPLWNPFLASGQPFAANPEHELFHPLTALFLLLRFDWAFRLQAILPVVLAPFPMLFLCRSVGASAPAALLAALSWGFGGYLLSTTCLLPILLAVSVLPAVLAFAVRLGAGGGTGDVAGLGVTFGLVALAGEPSTLLLSAPLLAAAAAHGLLIGADGGSLPSRTPPRLRTLAAARGLVLGLLLGLAIGAAVLLPGLDHARKTSRAGGISAEVAGLWSFPAERLWEVAVPGLVPGGGAAAIRLAAALYPGRDGPFLNSLYPGLLVAALALFAWSRKGPARRVWLPTGVLGLVVGMGTHLPVWPLLRRLPGLSSLRYPEKALLLLVVALVVSACLGLEALIRERPSPGRLAAAAAALAGLCLLAGASVHAIGGPMGAVLVPRLLRAALVAGCAAVLLAACRSRAAWLGAWIPAGVTLVDLVLAGPVLVPSRPVAALATPPGRLRPLLGGGFDRALFHLASYHPTLGGLPGLAIPPGPAQWGLRTALDRDYDLTELAWSARATNAVSNLLRDHPELAGPVLARRGIGAVLRFRPGAPRDPRVAERLPLDTLLELSQVVGSRPLAFCVDRAVAVTGVPGWREAVLGLGPAAAGAACLEAGQEGAAAVPPAPSRGSVTVSSWRPDDLELDVAVDGPLPALVAVNQTWDAGWGARVDGARTPYLLTDLSLGALLVPPGRHRVSLVYRNPLVPAGAAVSVAGLLVAAALARIRRR